MKKKIVVVLLVSFVALFSVFAEEDSWWIGKKITGFDVVGLKNVLSNDVNAALYEFRGNEFTNDLLNEIELKLYSIEGIKSVSTGVKPVEDGTIRVVLTVSENYRVSSVEIQGHSKIRKAEIIDSISEIVKDGDFVDTTSKLLIEKTKQAVTSLYLKNGFDSVPVEAEFLLNDENSTAVFSVTVSEGKQTRISGIAFEGNTEASSDILKKRIKQKAKSLLNRGYLDNTLIAEDESAVAAYYKSLGYLDVIVSHELTDAPYKGDDENLRTVTLTYKIDEGKKWYFGGVIISGNSIFDNEKVYSFFKLSAGDVLDMESIANSYMELSDLYYNNGYISSQIDMKESRDDTKMSVSFDVTITEGPQSVVDQININGLTKTLPYVMERELTLKSGDVFSKAKLITSAQNLYNTGLLANLDYNIGYGSFDNSINIDFNVEEGSHMDIQFGATFGGSASGFPVSGFLQWADHDFKGKAQELSISTTVSPDSQKISLSFGDGWFRNLRWANSISFSVEHTVYDDVLRLGTGATYDDDNHYPYPRESVMDDYTTSDIPSSDRMSYEIYSASAGYNTGYTFIFDSGRLGVSAGLSGSINKALYDDSVEPYNETIAKYHNAWKMSNKLSASLTWDGRDYTINTTKGYIVSLSGTYAGGRLGGISNYRKLTLSGSAYAKLFSFEIKEKTKQVMFCATSTISKIYNQHYKNDAGDWINGVEATDYEYLYIDGMTTARGFDTLYGFRFMADNVLEVSMPLVDNLLNFEIFGSATLCNQRAHGYSQAENGWYFAAGAGVKLKISGFPLGFYIVKNATKLDNSDFKWLPGTIFHRNGVDDSGLKFVLAISTSLI